MADTGSGANTTSTLDGLFKQVYPEKYLTLTSEDSKLQDMVKMEQADMVGLAYNQPVVLSYESGVTYAGTDAGAFALEDSAAGVMKNAQIKPTQIVLRSTIAYESLFRSMHSKGAFALATKPVVDNMRNTLRKRVELMLLHGQAGLGVIESQSGSGSTRAFVITAATWSPGLWSGMVGTRLDGASAAAATATQLNTNSAITVASVNIATRTVNVSGNSTDLTACVAGTVLFFRGAIDFANDAFNEFAGLNKIAQTTSGSLFGISTSTYDLWQPYVASSTGDLTFDKITDAAAIGAGKAVDGDLVALVSNGQWQNLHKDQSALRHIDASYNPDKMKQGTRGLEFYCQTGKIEIVPHKFAKDGEVALFQRDVLKRIGSTDITFKRPGRNDEIFRELSDNAGFELRAYTAQSLFCERPASLVALTGCTVA